MKSHHSRQGCEVPKTHLVCQAGAELELQDVESLGSDTW